MIVSNTVNRPVEVDAEPAAIRIDLLNARANVEALFDDDQVHDMLDVIRKAAGQPDATIALRTRKMPVWQTYTDK